MNHPVRLVDLEHRLQRLALEGQLAVGVVLEDPEAVLGGQLDQPHPLLGRERAAGRVVEVGDDVGELDRPLGERGFEGARGPARRPRAGPAPARRRAAAASRACGHKSAARPPPGRRPPAGARTASSRPPASRWRPSPAPASSPPCRSRDPLAKPRMPNPGAVGERLFPVLGERNRRSLAHRLARQDVGAGRPAGKRNRVVSHAPRH